MIKPLCGEFYQGGMWFRVFGYGLRVVNRDMHPPLRSERIGIEKVLRIGPWSIKWLRRGE